jgi:hypothetical protein
MQEGHLIAQEQDGYDCTSNAVGLQLRKGFQEF